MDIVQCERFSYAPARGNEADDLNLDGELLPGGADRFEAACVALRAAPERLGSYRGLQALRSRSLGVDLKLAVGRLAGEQRDQEQPPMPPQSPKNTKRAAVDTSVL